MTHPARKSQSASPSRGVAGANRCALGVMLASTVFATLSVCAHLGLQGVRVQQGAIGLAETLEAPSAVMSVYAPAVIGVGH
ncbi:hypothetical protein E4T66_14495 [Sinimarinibacterium sp. CAU 1509]|uniref:hypothetical protein n=1 Tax=Sinimarinibacterium sp. CAU 1509 TaxID=2562283 RepID=UPI0010ABB7F1|nr:hypothetical protein [Sinimarinibacterium sp. CAU 1509]TJY58808.1 hypothetical protein E4T66_14495 [Sinimarinibacterium sp. CAU 1509]